jgi:glycosyltransferase involved in cell wall biosynthesis
LSRPAVSIVIPTLGRETLYSLLEAIRTQDIEKPFEIVLVTDNGLDEARIDRSLTNVIHSGAGRGIASRRNEGFRSAAAEIVVFIDDDERPLNDSWLKSLVEPLLDTGETVATSGVAVPTGQGFIADIISSLGFPGGGSIGFKRMWSVDSGGHTAHICTGNFAIRKEALQMLGGFNEGLKHGAEDTYLARRLEAEGIRAVYVEEATVYHEPRKGLVEFFRWQIRRGRSAYQLKCTRELDRSLVDNRLASTWRILRSNLMSTRGPALLAMVFFEYFFQATGYGLEMLSCRLRSGVDRDQAGKDF